MFSMKLKYALKALIYIANKREAFAKAHDIAAEAHIPKKFLEHILLDLIKANIIKSKQGKYGGYFLIKSLDEISLADVYRIIIGPIALTLCASKNFYSACEDCANEATCKIKWASVQVRSKVIDEMEHIKISTLASV